MIECLRNSLVLPDSRRFLGFCPEIAW